ncbi:DUF1311 domain-containing protein [bacterium]|nr:MAG: DUF1311 domain-containing protein [bacterium]
MKACGFLILFSFLILANTSFSQSLKKQKSTDQEVNNLMKKLIALKIDTVYIEFSIDTFLIERQLRENLKNTISDFDMREAYYTQAQQYDSLMNKYYKKLKGVLKDEDKKVLVSAQKAWLTIRDLESDLTETISEEKYSGGGTLQKVVEATEYLAIVRTRTINIFDHYTRAIQAY